MSWTFKKAVDELSKSRNFLLFGGSKHGLEREVLRVNEKGEISQKDHPKSLGSTLTNEFITTDFAEAQIELITPPFNSETKCIDFLEKLHVFVSKNLDNELLWPFSMPARLLNEKKIKIAKYGSSAKGKKKELYRIGLAERYGKKMQTVSGTHYNFSFSEKFWDFMYKKFDHKSARQDFINDSYLKLARNFLRFSWLNSYLFGASPAIDKTYCKRGRFLTKRLNWHTCYGPHATSLRMSEVGYYSKVQAQLAVSFDSLESYIHDLNLELTTPSAQYKGLKGLNENILQIANEHYSRVRVKQPPLEGETPLCALAKRGVKYIEVRAVDINPFSPSGLLEDQLCFLHLFVIYCLLKESKTLSKSQQKALTQNQNKVGVYGRKPGLKLNKEGKEVYLKTWGEEILKDMQKVAELLDRAHKVTKYSESLKHQFEKLENPEKTPSAQIMQELKREKISFLKYGLKLAKKHRAFYEKAKLPASEEERFENSVKKSLLEQEKIEIWDEVFLDGYEDMEVSTQILMKEALKRGVTVEVLDRHDNFLRLSKGRKSEIIKQATKTSKDSYITFLIMENKGVSKIVLDENGIKVPKGKTITSQQEGEELYVQFKNSEIIVKPVHTNFGIGVSKVEKNSLAVFKSALKEAFSHGPSVIVEEFVKGEEYRLLVVDNKCIAVTYRIPSNVEGDGIHTIKQLIALKNEDPKNYKIKKYYGRLGEAEKAKLKSQRLTPKSIPKKGEVIFLRDNSNVSTGGDAIDMTDEMHDSYKKLAVKAAHAANAKICGVDMMIKDLKTPATNNNYGIIEINFNPVITMHNFPYRGKNRHVEKAVLDFLGFK